MNNQRISKFNKWWNTNHHYTLAHRWLIKHSRRVMHNYMIAPEQFDQAKVIQKRYNNSEYKRINKTDATFLWRLIHPTMNERRERLLASATYYASIVDHKQLSK